MTPDVTIQRRMTPDVTLQRRMTPDVTIQRSTCTQEFEASLSELKPRMMAVLSWGKRLKDNCSAKDNFLIYRIYASITYTQLNTFTTHCSCTAEMKVVEIIWSCTVMMNSW